MLNLRSVVTSVGLLLSTHAFAAPPTPQSVETLILNNGLKSGLDNAVTGIQTRMQQSILQAVLAENKGTPISAGQRAAMDKVTPPVAQYSIGTDRRCEHDGQDVSPHLHHLPSA